MLSFFNNLLFLRESIADRDTNAESNLIIGKPLGLRIFVDNIPEIEDIEVQSWLQKCINETLADIMM